MSDSNRRYSHVARAVLGTPWFIRPAEGAVISALVRGRLAGEMLAQSEIVERVQAARAQQGPRGGSTIAGPVAIVPIYGVIMPRANLMTEMSGGTTVEWIRAAMEDAIRDKDIAAVIGEFDSPGGSVEGIEELATWIREQRGTKPMVAVVNTMACSAAYYLAAQFDEIVASPSSLTGSIGVYMEHVEYSRMDDIAGITTTIVQEPASKHDINDSQPLPDAALAHLQQIVVDFYGQFAGSVAKGRGVSVSAVRDGFGQGRELTSKRAVEAGLADRVATLDDTIRRLASGRGRAAMQPAAWGWVANGTDTATGNITTVIGEAVGGVDEQAPPAATPIEPPAAPARLAQPGATGWLAVEAAARGYVLPSGSPTQEN